VDDVELAAQAYVAGYPLVVSVRTMQRLAGLMGVNRLVWQDRLAGPRSRVIVAPNRDTLYSVAVLDLRSEPMALRLPESPTGTSAPAPRRLDRVVRLRRHPGRPAAGPAPGWSGADGSLEIVLAHDEPAAPDGAAVNWLPVPAGPFVLMLRL
jgi:hypothetical protein